MNRVATSLAVVTRTLVAIPTRRALGPGRVLPLAQPVSLLVRVLLVSPLPRAGRELRYVVS